jgi:oligo-1,6-glucosidase
MSNGPLLRADPPADWRRWVVYQVYPRSFADSDADGVGDLRGVLSRLDYLERLGVDVVWLSPVYRSPMDDNGYDISDYQDIDPLFGTLADLDELIAELHARGMRLVMDLVVNHTSDEHPWFVESRSSRDNPKRDWYWWRDPRPGATPGTPGAEPTNWESHFSGPTWTWDERTGQYYLHIFSAKQPDLNWENPEVRQAVYAMMRWWLDRGVDGFRMDVINMISKDTSLPDTESRPGSPYGPGDQHFSVGPRNHEYLQEMYREVFDARPDHVLTVGEMPLVTIAQAVQFTAPERHELDMVFQFEHVRLDQGAHKYDLLPLTLPDLKRSMAAWQAGLELALLRQPRPAALGVAVRRRRRAPGGLGQDPGHGAASAPGDPLRLPGGRARHGQRAPRRHHRLP